MLRLVSSVLLAAVALLGCESVKERERREALENAKPLIRQLERSNACPGCTILFADLSHRDFSAANLQGAYLAQIHAEGIVLRGANLSGGGVLNDNLKGADLRNLLVREGAVAGYLQGADLRGSVFEGHVSLTPFDAHGARMDGLDLRDILHAEMGNWSGASLRGADLRKVAFKAMHGSNNRIKSNFSRLEPGVGGSRLIGTDLRDADLRGTDFNSCDLSGADLRGAKLAGASFVGTDLRNAKLDQDSLADADFGVAIWIDGTECEPLVSKGKCVPPPPKTNSYTVRTSGRGCAPTCASANDWVKTTAPYRACSQAVRRAFS